MEMRDGAGREVVRDDERVRVERERAAMRDVKTVVARAECELAQLSAPVQDIPAPQARA